MEQGVYQQIERVLSQERLAGYQTSHAKQYCCSLLALYRWNTWLSESFYPLLQTLEVVLRNAIYQSVAKHFNDPNWLLNSKVLDARDQIEVEKQEARLIKSEKEVTVGRLIAELNFGFWTTLLDARYEMKLWRSKIIKKAFLHMPTSQRTRRNLSSHFNKIRKFGNCSYGN